VDQAYQRGEVFSHNRRASAMPLHPISARRCKYATGTSYAQQQVEHPAVAPRTSGLARPASEWYLYHPVPAHANWPETALWAGPRSVFVAARWVVRRLRVQGVSAGGRLYPIIR